MVQLSLLFFNLLIALLLGEVGYVFGVDRDQLVFSQGKPR